MLVTVVYNWIDLISDQFVGLPPADYLYLDALMLEKKMLVLMLINVGFCT